MAKRPQTNEAWRSRRRLCAVLAGIGLAGWASAAQSQRAQSGAGHVAPGPPTFAVGVRNVNLDVQVSRGGRRVGGLTASDFVVKDNGVRQQVEVVSQEEVAVDAVLALDASSSVSGSRLEELQRAAHAFVGALWPADQITLIGFAGDLRLRARPGASRAEVQASIDAFQGKGSTSLRDALYAALLLTDPGRGRPLVLVFSDGRDRGSWLSEETVRTVARSSDAVIDAVLVGEEGQPFVGDERQPFLEEVTRDTGGRSWTVRKDLELEQVFLAALEDFKGRYRLRYEPQGVRSGGWHALSVKLEGKKGEVLSRRGYQGEAAE